MKCLIDGCDSAAKIRGLCPTCYGAAAAAVKKDLTDWSWLEIKGLANKPQHKSSGYGAFAIALRKQLAPLYGNKQMMDKDIVLETLQQAKDGVGCTIEEFQKEVSNGK